ncbi:MAG TPA: Spy/CpxP family protein refolding chaperone [Burkholderiaceae bacterium]|nr:Spy/CpxP family protein refolding chaperone [Burkholderiaceae bacterium]
MTFSTSKFNQKLAIAALVAAAFGATAFAQNATPGTPTEGRGGMQHQMGKMNADGQGKGFMHERMQAHRQARAEKRLAELKTKLKITAAQEGAWTTFTTAMKPPANGAMGVRHDPAQHAEMQKLSTPERLDKMRAMRQGRQTLMNAEMDKRADATKAFYATLSSEQKAVFDAVAMQWGRHFGRGDHGGKMGGHHGGMGGEHRGQGRMGPAS